MSRLRELIEQGLTDNLYLGASFRLFTRDGAVVDEGWCGRAQADPNVAVSPSTVWDLASMTKPVATATSLLILAQEGECTLGDEVRRFLPAESFGEITLKHCMTHVSGLKSWAKYHSQGFSRSEVVRRVLSTAPDRKPREGYTYSDLGYITLGEVVGVLAGMPVDQFAKKQIFDPLQMADTGYRPPNSLSPRIAATHCEDRGRVLVGEVHDGNCNSMDGVAGHAGLFGTLNDLQRYGEMLLNQGARRGVKILAPPVAREMATNQNPEGLNGQTLGWFTRPNGYLPAGDFLPMDTFGHTGFTGTSMLLSPSLGLGVLLLTNRVAIQREATEFLRFRRRFHNAVAGSLG